MRKKITGLLLVLFIVIAASVFTQATRPAPTGSACNQDHFVEFIGHFMSRRTGALTEPAGQEPVPQFPQPLYVTAKETGETITESESMLYHEQAARASLDDSRYVMALHGTVYTRFETEITPISHNITSDTATITVNELTRLFFPDRDWYTAWSVEREFIFTRTSQGWTLVAHGLLGSGKLPPPNDPSFVPREDMIKASQVSII